MCTLQDVAQYTALCGLATYTRDQLRSNLLNNIEYQKILDYVPEYKDIIDNYYNNNYINYITQLNKFIPILQLDMYIGTHVNRLITHIRDISLINYITPYNNISMNDICDVYQLSMDQLELILVRLIQSHKLSARIDSIHHVIYKYTSNQRVDTYNAVLSSGTRYINDVSEMLLRYDLLDQNISIGDINKQSNNKSTKLSGKPHDNRSAYQD